MIVFASSCCSMNPSYRVNLVSVDIIPGGCVDVAASSVFLPERPDPPTDLELTDQKKRSVQLTWIPGDEHSSPIESMCVCCLHVFLSVL